MHEKSKFYFESLRLERWPRSLAILPGFIAAVVLRPEDIKDLSFSQLAIRPVIAFFLTLIISTANYIINEIADAPFDAFHPQKKERPLVRGVINKKYLLMIWVILILIATIISIFLLKNFNLLLSLGALLLAGILYNVPPIRIKDIPFLDSTLESANNPIRFMIGWLTVSNNSFPWWLLVSWWAFGNFLMIGKRVAEKKFLTGDESRLYRRSLAKYTQKSLIIFMMANAVIFTATFIVFSFSTGMITLLYSIPFIIIYLAMFIKKSLQDIEGAEEPEKLLKNPYFALYTIFLGALFILAYLLK